MPQKRQGLVLDVPYPVGNYPYVIPGVGAFTKDEPVPVGDGEKYTLEQAQEWDKDKSITVKLVDLKEPAKPQPPKEEG